MWTRVKNFSTIILPLAWMGLIYYFSDQSVLPGPEAFWLDVVTKKVAHIVVYAGLYWCWWRWAAALRLTDKRGWRYVLVVFCVLYAIFDEWHQGQVSGRIMSGRDVLLDSYASLLACWWSARLL